MKITINESAGSRVSKTEININFAELRELVGLVKDIGKLPLSQADKIAKILQRQQVRDYIVEISHKVRTGRI